MDFIEFVKTRQSDRAFDPNRPVEKEKIDRIIRAVQLAPSACNAQPWHLIVVDDPELKNKVADATSTRVLGINHFTKQAPVHILLVEEKVNLMSGVGGWIKNKDYAQKSKTFYELWIQKSSIFSLPIMSRINELNGVINA